jgi:hypothetical protein
MVPIDFSGKAFDLSGASPYQVRGGGPLLTSRVSALTSHTPARPLAAVFSPVIKKLIVSAVLLSKQ